MSEFDKSEVTCIGIPSATTTGEMEVRVLPGGKLLHSKLSGDGYIDTEDKLNAIIDAVADALDEAKAAKAKPAAKEAPKEEKK